MGPVRPDPPELAAIRSSERVLRDPGQAGRVRPLLLVDEREAAADAGNAQTKMRMCAIDAASQRAGVPSPSGNAIVEALNGVLALRPPGKERRPLLGTPNVSRRDSFVGSAPEMPQDLPPGARRGTAPAPGALACRIGPSAGPGRHRMLLSDATVRYDDLNMGQLGDVLFEDGRTVIAISGSKCNRGGASKPAALPAATRPGSGSALLVDSVRRAVALPLEAPPEALATLARGFAAAGQARHPPGPAAVATFFGPWLFQCSGMSCPGRPFSWQASSPRAPSGRSPPGPSARSKGRLPLSGRTACGGMLRRPSFTPVCRVPSSRRRCGLPPHGRTRRASLSQLS